MRPVTVICALDPPSAKYCVDPSARIRLVCQSIVSNNCET
jgi:hypothetical protein